MGHHANVGTSLRPAPRAIVTERVTGYAQAQKFETLAGPVFTMNLRPDVTPTMVAFIQGIADRKITRLTETMLDYRKVSGTRWELTLRWMDARIVVRKVNATKKSPWTGWVAELVPMGAKTGHVVCAVAKGDAIETNGERSDCCRAAMNVLQATLIKLA